MKNKIQKPQSILGWSAAFCGALTIAILSGCAQHVEKSTQAPSAQDPFILGNAVSGEILVQTDKLAAVEKLRQTYDVTSVDVRGGVYSIRGGKLAGHEAEVIEALERSGEFDVVEPNFIRHSTATALEPGVAMPKDRKWLDLWALKNYGQDAPGGMEGLAGADIKALDAWKVTTGSRDIVVAVVDTGIDYTHPDLFPNVWKNEAELNGTPGVDDDKNGYVDDKYGWDFESQARATLSHGQLGDADPMDDHGHGTHVSGTIGAVGNNVIGVTGINWNVRIMGCKFLSASGSGTSADEVRAIRYALENGADIINASYGGGGKSKITENLIREAGKRGLLFVAAAGNESSDNDAVENYPSNYKLDNIIAVAATDNRDQLAEFSNFGYENVHLAAPGVAITSTFPVALAKKDESDPQPYRTWSGTSMATPHVVGAAALLLAAHPDLRRKPAEIKKRLMETADWLPQLASKVASGGRLNLARAVSNEPGVTPLAQANWTEEPFALATPNKPTELVDRAWKIQKKGVKAIRAHIRKASIDEQYDLGVVYDTFFRPITQVPSSIQDYWTPAVYGDTLYVKFSNALVNVRTVKEIKDVDDPDSIPEDEKDLVMFCEQDAVTNKYTCHTYNKPTEPFANFTSEGIEIDKISFLPGN